MGFLDFLKRKPAVPAPQASSAVTLAAPSTAPGAFAWPADLGGSAPPPPGASFSPAAPTPSAPSLPAAPTSPSNPALAASLGAPSPTVPIAPRGHLSMGAVQEHPDHVRPHTLPDFTQEDLSVFDPKTPREQQSALASTLETPLMPPSSSPGQQRSSANIAPIPVVIVPSEPTRPAQPAQPENPTPFTLPPPPASTVETQPAASRQLDDWASDKGFEKSLQASQRTPQQKKPAETLDVLSGIAVGKTAEPSDNITPPAEKPVIPTPQPLPPPEKPRFISSAGYLDVIGHTRAVRKTLRQGDDTIKEALARSEQLDQLCQRVAADANAVQESLMRIDAALYEEVP